MIRPYHSSDRDAILDLSLRAWEPVFDLMPTAVPAFVLAAFYPDGWRARQLADLGAALDEDPAGVHVAVEEGVPVGWVSVKLHPEDRMGEIHVLAVDPAHQRRGIGTALMEHAFQIIRSAGLGMVMVETGGDPGHAPARAGYEAAGFQRWPVARYFKDLTADRGAAEGVGFEPTMPLPT